MLLLIGLVLAVAAAALVLQPILAPTARPPDRLTASPDTDPVLERKERALAALKEIDFDRATGKLAEDDYQRMRARYTAEALEAFRAADGGSGGSPLTARPPDRLAALDVESLIAQARQAARGQRFCTECGAELEGSGRFCVECGTKAAA